MAYPGKYEGYHGNYLTPHQTDEYLGAADRVLIEYSKNIVAGKRSEFLEEALTHYRTDASKGHGKFRKWGIAEATSGALLWSLLLLLFAFIIKQAGIDVVEVFKRVFGVH